jgi:N-glycosidase YbiA
MQLMSGRVLQFYSTKDAYGEFSNFAAFPVEIDGRIWPTSEHYFQAQKFAGTEHEELIRATPSPMTVAKMGRDRKRPLRADWEEVKDDVMRKAVCAKFKQHPRLAAMLFETGDAEIVEHTDNDAYWGDGGDGKGVNRLGQILMEVRAELSRVGKDVT